MLECWSPCMYVGGSWQCLQQVGVGHLAVQCGNLYWQLAGLCTNVGSNSTTNHPPANHSKITQSSYPGSSQYPGWDILCRIRESKACKRQVTGSTRAFRDFSKIPNGGTLCWPPNYASRQWPRPKYY